MSLLPARAKKSPLFLIAVLAHLPHSCVSPSCSERPLKKVLIATMHLVWPHPEPSLAQELLDWSSPASPLSPDPLAEGRCRTADMQPMVAHRQGYPVPLEASLPCSEQRLLSPRGPLSSRGWAMWVQSPGCCPAPLAALLQGHVGSGTRQALAWVMQ